MEKNKDQHKPNILLKHEREKRGWSQNKLGELIGADPTMISRWERGSRNPERLYQEKLCEVFNKNAIELGFMKHTSNSVKTASEAPTPFRQSLQDELDRTESSINLPQETWRVQRRQILAHYLEQQHTHILNALIPGSTNLCVRDMVDNSNLFIPPPWEMVQGIATSTNLVKYLVDTLIAGQRILLLGDAGQGKTTVLKQVFHLLAHRFLNEPESSNPLPIYIPLREFSSLTGNAIELLWTHVHDELALPFEDFASFVRNKHIVFLFDGFDEIKGEITQRSLNERTASKMFAQPSILTCRKSFFEFHLSMSPLQEHYPQWIELQPLALTPSVSRYIAAFYQHKQHRTAQRSLITPESMRKTIQKSQELRDLARRPLLLVMMLDIFTEPRETREEEWNVTKLYGKYTEKWLKNEAAKPGSLLKWNEKAQLLQETAWLTYTAKASTSSPYRLNQSETFTHNELASVLKNLAGRYHPVTATQLLDELCFRTLLAVSEADNYYFLHKTFHEYYVARYIFEHMRTRSHHTDTVTIMSKILQEVLPFEVVTFLKEMLNSKETAPSERDLIVHNLIKVYQMHQGDDLQLVTIRQHASHYLTSLGTPRAIQFLEQTYNQEPNKWVQRGIMVGLALYCNKTDILERYITMIRNDPEVASINLGYHLVYYGDQAQECGYYDQRGERCDGTLRSLFRHLNNERHKNSWPLDILTLSAHLETRGRAILASHQQELPFLKAFLKQEHREQQSTFQQEKEHLEKILQGANLWK